MESCEKSKDRQTERQPHWKTEMDFGTITCALA